MPSDEMPDAAFTHTVRGFFGEELTIGAYPPEGEGDGGAVQFVIRDEQGEVTSAHISSPAEREALAKALMEAYRIADGERPVAAPPPPQDAEAPQSRTVTIPASDQHQGLHSIRVTIPWTCPQCGGPRGEPFETISYDGSLRLGCDGWKNPCGHVDRYSAVRREAKALADGGTPASWPCAMPAGCGNGPGPHPFTPVAGDPLPRPCCRQPQEVTVVPAVLAADDCGCGLGPERCAAAEDGDLGG